MDYGHYASDHMTEAQVALARTLPETIQYALLCDIPMRDLIDYRLRDERSAVIAAQAIISATLSGDR